MAGPFPTEPPRRRLAEAGVRRRDLRHAFHAYRSPEELLETCASFLRASLERGEAICWVVAPCLSESRVIEAIGRSGEDSMSLRRSGRLELLDHRSWYLERGALRPIPELIARWAERERRALEAGHRGLAVTGDGTSCLEAKDDLLYLQYERTVDSSIRSTTMRALCTYSAACLDAVNLREVARSHDGPSNRYGEVLRERGDGAG